MQIGIDARFYGTEHTGLGRYTKNVLLPLTKYLNKDRIFVYLRDPYFDQLSFPAHVTKIRCNLPHYSIREQLVLPALIRRHGLDLWFSFHFLIPVFSTVPQICVIHDLIKTFSRGRDTTTRAPWLYSLKRWGYQLAIDRAVKHSRELIVPSNSVKNDLLAQYNLPPEKIHPIWEAPDPALRARDSSFKNQESKRNFPKKFILFVGNAYPHKNLGVLFQALALLPAYQLVVVASETPYLRRLLSSLRPAVARRITLVSKLSDPELALLYRQAQALIAPSLMEGFGLPGLEALVMGTPVVASDIPVFREVYQDNAIYFAPHSPQALAKQLKSLRPRAARPLRYPRTWNKVAKEIGKVVNASCASL